MSIHLRSLVASIRMGMLSMEERQNSFHVGQHVGWNSEAGHVTGRIVKIHTRDFDVNGYIHHCTPESPQYEIKSLKTDHVAYHKASALHHVA